jgi:hypothetical protein
MCPTIPPLPSEEGAEYALIGGYAIAAHGYNRFSEGIDLLVKPTTENTEPLPVLSLEGLLLTKEGMRRGRGGAARGARQARSRVSAEVRPERSCRLRPSRGAPRGSR